MADIKEFKENDSKGISDDDLTQVAGGFSLNISGGNATIVGDNDKMVGGYKGKMEIGIGAGETIYASR